VAPHEDQEDSQSYYSKHSDEDGEELKEAYKILYVEFEKLRETRKQHIHELNSLITEKSSLLLKIQDLEKKLLETQLQLKRVTDENLTHMLSIQKIPANKTNLGYVASSSDIPSTSKIIFVKTTIPEPPFVGLDKGNEVIDGDVPASAKATQKPSIIKRPPICHHCGLSGHIRPQCSLLKAYRSKFKKEVPRQATFGTRPLAHIRLPSIKLYGIKPHGIRTHGIRLLSINGINSDLFLPIRMANSRKKKSRNYMNNLQKLEDDQFYRKLPIWLQSMVQWMDHQMKSCQQPPQVRQAWVKKDEDIHPLRGNGLT
jgi:hypothetical protein